MTVEMFFANFGHLADAPNGVQKLRELILQLAVQGKLVPQVPSDEPASVLLERIEVEKERLVKSGVVKKSKKTSLITESDRRFELPKSWQWVRLGDALLKLTDGTHHSPTNTENGDFKYVTAKNIKNFGVQLSNISYVTKEVHEEIFARCNPEIGDLLYIKDGATTGIVTINDLDEPFSMLSSVALLKLPQGFYNGYLLHVLRSPFFYDLMREDMSGVAITRVTLTKMNNAMVPIAPEVEQKRIVAKVDQLMSLCNELEARQQKKQQGRVRLNKASLDALLTSREPDEFADRWQRISTNFDLLYDHPETIAKLRAAILQLAVQGKLVPQDPSDEPASVLLERIKAEKERLLREKMVKKGKDLAPIEPNLLPWKLPEPWQWIRFGEIAADLRYGTSKRCDYKIIGDPVLRIPNLKKGVVDVEDLKFTNLTDKEKQDLSLKEGDLLLIRSNGSVNLVGRSAVIGNSLDGYSYAGYLVRVRSFPQLISTKYVHLMLESSYVRIQIEGPIRTTSGVKNINSTEISNLLISVPPLEEQKRIVARVDQLMTLCDDLEAKLNQAQRHSEKLMEATVRQLLVA